MHPNIKRNSFSRAALLAACLLLWPCSVQASGLDAVRAIPIQHNGRVKSFDTFCRQVIETVTGKERWQKKPSVQTILTLLAQEETIPGTAWIKIDRLELIRHLGLPEGRHYFSYDEVLVSLDKIEALVRASRANRDKDQKPSRLEQSAEALYTKLVVVKQLMSGEFLRLIPSESPNGAWLSPYQSIHPRAPVFKKMADLAGKGRWDELNTAAAEWNRQTGTDSANRFDRTIHLELLYNDLHTFRWAWIAYLLAFLCFSPLKRYGKMLTFGAICLGLAIPLHTAGLVLRVLILERPPVSNMYESMVYMNWALMIFALIFWAFRRNLVILSVGSAISALIMIYGDLLPIDSNLEVLVPVLRSNYWLTIHVMTIVSSYGAFGLAMGLGHRHLILDARRKLSKQAEADSANLIHRVIQLGTLLLGIGTVLGGVWANESWGRFWGWDPKETWALITFLGYLILIHLRYSRKIDDFWTAISSILGFFFVLMTWYGVNFVLGRGLHSYGFGSGGMIWVIYYLVLEVVFLAVILMRRYRPKPVKR